MKTFWLIGSALCIIVAAVFVWQLDFSKAFAVAVVGILCWFLNYRAQMKEVIKAADEENDKGEGSSDF